ncbi:hypothetical protein HZU40_13995 [Mycolicibacterium fluoranthenivorans]|uniref:Transmembrane protein n=1 Tax=Mycolicibacterium fluoranthenivorans TaxID=258505 RepID=A0A7G8PLM9_9MYCO|nr:hypothetical protein [Mycolicibacterium fluoranthenivorans]QNJ95245.1 hypothetical protein HZU40_13995 [Mycolicibacterium fluoranthenivorans]
MAVPSLSQIQSWDTDHLDQAATRWTNTADAWKDSFDSISRQIANPGGQHWIGTAAEAAQSRTSLDQLKVQGLSDDLRAAATAARAGSAQIEAAKKAALYSVGEAHAEGFVVNEDLSLTDLFTTNSTSELTARSAQAQVLAAEIQAKAEALAAADQHAADTIAAAAAGLQAAAFEPSDAPDDPQIQMVDFHGVPLPEKPSWTSPDLPPGGWSDDPITRAAQKIAYGHASTKHLANEWPPGTTREQLASEVERIMRAGTNPNGGMIVGRTSDGAPAIYDPKTNTLVIRDPGAADAGTVFKPTRGEPYLADKVPTRLPSLPPSEVADAPPRPRAEPPKIEPPISRGGTGAGVPPIVGVPPVVGLPGVGAGDVPILDSDGMPDVGFPGAGR